ncbi:nucleoside deaminase [bacterium]|nr:nucleoside deaminase [bacterium]
MDYCFRSLLEIRKTMDKELLNRWMGRALELAQKAREQDEIPIGCIIVVENRIISEGINLRETTHKTTAHAEVVALESYNLAHQTWRLPEESWVFVTAEPCLMCTGALLWARAPRIVYGCSDPRQAGLKRVSHGSNRGFSTIDLRRFRVGSWKLNVPKF